MNRLTAEGEEGRRERSPRCRPNRTGAVSRDFTSSASGGPQRSQPDPYDEVVQGVVRGGGRRAALTAACASSEYAVQPLHVGAHARVVDAGVPVPRPRSALAAISSGR